MFNSNTPLGVFSLSRRDDDDWDDDDDDPRPPSFKNEIVLAVAVAATAVATERLVKWGVKELRRYIKARRKAMEIEASAQQETEHVQEEKKS